MKESYCIVDKRVTPCTEPSGYQQDKRGRTQFYCKCAVCGNKKVRYVKSRGNLIARLKGRAFLILLLALQLMDLFITVYLGWVKKQLKWGDMEQVN